MVNQVLRMSRKNISMKKISQLLLFIGCMVLVRCSNDGKNKKPGDPAVNNADTVTHITNKSTEQASGDGIVGQWKLRLEAYDDNHNHLPDPEELNKGSSNKYYYKFNSDGSCLIHEMKFKGHYEIKQVDGKRKLSVYRDEGESPGLESEYEIVSVNNNELVLLWEITFWIFKRV